MFVAMDKITAVKMYDLISEEWTVYLETRKKEIEKIADLQEQITQQREWDWAKATEISVVVSHEQNEIDKFEAWGLDIEPHRLKMNTRNLEEDFKAENHPFRIAIVCAMWITGFDVKSLSTLYLDKPMKSHTLMQTIARANRVHEDKNNGLIVDYIETYKALLEALAIYGDSGSKGNPTGTDEVPVRPLEELIADLDETIQATDLFLEDECKFKVSKIIDAEDNLYRIKFIEEGYNALCKNDETRNKFGILAREVFKKYKALMPDNAIYEYKDQRDAINALYSLMNDNIDKADVSHVVSKVQYVVNQSIESLNMVMEQVEGYGQKIDLSGLDFQKIEEEFLKIEDNKNIAVQSLKDRVAKKMNRLLDQNPMRIDFYERYQEIIENYNNGKEYATVKELFDALILLLGDLSEEEKRAERELLDEDELTVFDMLNRDKKITDKEKTEVKDTAKKLLEHLKNNEFKVEYWSEKTQTASAVKKAINDCLYTKLPFPTFSDGDRVVKTEILFDYFKTRYANFGRVA
jgi:type I restriction enzyme R subunit